MKHLSVSLQNPHGNSAHHIVKCYSRRSRAYTWQYSLNTFGFSSHQNKQLFCVSFLAHIDFLQLTMQKTPIQTTILLPHYCRTRYSSKLGIANPPIACLTLHEYAQVHSLFIYLVVQVGYIPFGPRKGHFVKNTLHLFLPGLYFNHPSLCIAF